MSLQQQFDHVEQRIAAACERSGRKREDVKVVAVTKYASMQATEQLLLYGYRHIGESRWPDAEQKWTSFREQGIWHFIGHLQTNKVRHVIDKFSYIHSLDRPSLAKELERRAAAQDMSVNCFIQVNVSGEQSKFGCKPEAFLTFAEQVSTCPHLRVVGLMTMAPYEASEAEVRRVFSTLRHLRDELNERRIFAYDVPHLSMGMSNDFEIAIEEGATFIRLGSILVNDGGNG